MVVFEIHFDRQIVDCVPFETEFGFHILQVTERREYDGTDEVRRDKARRAIRRQKIDERRQSWLRRLRDEAYVEYRGVE